MQLTIPNLHPYIHEIPYNQNINISARAAMYILPYNAYMETHQKLMTKHLYN